jgi:AAA family ATP:ADP antiporter
MRDEMAIAGGIEKLQWMFTGTFVVMLAAVPLFGWMVRRFPLRQFLPCVYFIQIQYFSRLRRADVFHLGQCL